MKETDPLVVPNGDATSPPPAATTIPSVLFLLRNGGVVLQNRGSTARDHLANERTFLAWIRTALSILGVGIGLLKWQGIANEAGYLVLGLGVVVLITSTWRYLSVMHRLSESQFEPNVQSALSIVVVILLVIIGMLVLKQMEKL